MALVKCKECGEEVSTKAKACPKCGAKPPKKTSVITWIVLGLIVIGVFAANNSPAPSASPPSSNTPKNTASVNQPAQVNTPELPKSSWSNSTSKDEMTGEKSAYANSLTVGPTKTMGFPYQDTQAWLGVGCDSKSEWVYVGFNTAPNLNDTEITDGHNIIKTRIKFDESIENVTLIQKWGASSIHFDSDASIITKIMNSKSALLELQWHGEQQTYFEFPLNGAGDTIQAIRVLCAK